MQSKKMLIATGNKGKAREFEQLFKTYGYEIETLLDYPEIPEIPETGSSFQENAFQKAEFLSKQLGTIVLADDSGLEVQALDGAPGIYSARYAGEHGDDDKNNAKLVKDLKELNSKNRAANFICSLALIGPDREPLFVEGKVFGTILDEPRGKNGFGYDPLFYLPDLKKTMAELSDAEKNEISHRAQAIKNLEKHLQDWL